MIDKYQFGSNKIPVLLIQNPPQNPHASRNLLLGSRDDLSEATFNWGNRPGFWASTKLPRTWIPRVFYIPKNLRWKVQIVFDTKSLGEGSISKKNDDDCLLLISGKHLDHELGMLYPSQFGLMIPICDLYINEEWMDLKSLAFFAASFLALSSAFGAKNPRWWSIWRRGIQLQTPSNKSNIIRTTPIFCFKICNKWI